MTKAFQVVYSVTLSTLIAVFIAGCGMQATGTSPVTSTAVSITTQPASQTVPLGNAATFDVDATGSGTIHYQWYENGYAIPNANNASYTTAEASAEDSGEKFSVQVSNSVSTLTSIQAVLTVGPRSPKAGDLRFQEVDAPSEANQGNDTDTLTTGVVPGYLTQADNATGSPLQIGGACVPGNEYDCIWAIWRTALPAGQTGLSFYTYSDAYSSFVSDISGGVVNTYDLSGATSNVITSLDLDPASSSYAVAWVNAGSASTFNMERQSVAPNAVSSTVATDAQQGRVVTALSFDDSTGDVDLISYTWKGDPSTVYDTLVLSSSPSDVASTASTLANDGYIITACGGNTNDGYLLVGTKVHGDTLPRPLFIWTSLQPPFTAAQTAGYAPVAWVWYPVQGTTTGAAVRIYEK